MDFINKPHADKILQQSPVRCHCMCLAEGTIILTKLGLKLVEDIVEGGGKVLSGEGKRIRVAALIYKGESETVRIKSVGDLDGLTLTPDHEVMYLQRKDQWGLKDREGNVLVAPKYKEVAPFAENKAIVRFGIKWGVIDKDGNELVAPIYERIEQHDNLLAVRLNTAWQLIDDKGNKIGQRVYNKRSLFPSKNTSAGYKDESGTAKQYEWD